MARKPVRPGCSCHFVLHYSVTFSLLYLLHFPKIWYIMICLKNGQWEIIVEFSSPLCYIRHRKSTHSKVDASDSAKMSLRTPPILLADRIGFFYFFLFLLSRKARNAIIKLPKAANSVSMPMKIEIISNAVISRTSLPMYSWQARTIGSRGSHPVMGLFPVAFATFTIIPFIAWKFNQYLRLLVVFLHQLPREFCKYSCYRSYSWWYTFLQFYTCWI